MSFEEMERLKRKNLLQSYYAQNSSTGGGEGGVGNSLGAGDSSSLKNHTNTASSSSSSTLSNATNSSFNSSEYANNHSNQISTSSQIQIHLKDPYDLNSTVFESDLFLKKLIKEKTLTEIMDVETEIVKETRKLDSEMQTLVSENYNKFISATDTIRKMRSDFKKMEEEMENLVVNMGEITEFNEKINFSFKDGRKEISRLSDVDTLLKKLQFLFDLPTKLNQLIEKNSYSMAVKYYSKARKTLDRYKQMPTFKSIEDDCQAIIKQLKVKLYERIDNNTSRETNSSENIFESVNLLYQLDEPMENLCSKYLEKVEKCLNADLSILVLNIDLISNSAKKRVSKEDTSVATAAINDESLNNNQIAMDILEFVDHGCNNFLANLSSIIQSYNTIFIENNLSNEQKNEENHFNVDYAIDKLNLLVKDYWLKYCEIIRRRFEVEQNLGENTIIVRAVDRFYRRIQTINKQIPNIDLSKEASKIALYAAFIRVNFYLQVLKEHFSECLFDLRHNVALLANPNNPITISSNVSSTITTSSSSNPLKSIGVNEKKLQQFHDTIFKSISEQIKNVLTNLQAFLASDVSFSAKVHFNEPFCKDYVRETLLVPYLKHIAFVSKEFANGTHDPVPYPLLLILSKLCLEFESVSIDYFLTLADEQFFISDKSGLTNKRELSDLYKESAKALINHYVKVRGLNISQMIRKSVETRDWLNTIEPRNVRAVMKRIVEDLTSIDIQVGELFEMGVRKEKGSDSSRNTFTNRTQTQRSAAWSFTPSNNADSKLMNNIQKLFAEKIEIFSQVEFSKISVLTGIVKITLKTLLECIRLKTFSKYGLQQIQVDCHYLQLYLWRFVNDENLVYVLLEEILTSSIQRCTEPQLMESRVVELICETA